MDGTSTVVTALPWLGVAVIAGLLILDALRRTGVRVAREALARIGAAPVAVHLTVAALLLTATVHGALVAAHLQENPPLGVLFALSAAAALPLSIAAYAGVPHWRPPAATLLAALIIAYLASRISHAEEWDLVGLVTKAVEAIGLACLAMAARTTRRSLPTTSTGADTCL